MRLCLWICCVFEDVSKSLHLKSKVVTIQVNVTFCVKSCYVLR